MKEKLLYRAPQVYWSDLVANEIICYSSDIDEYNYQELTWD
jgi:hypothetical protein